MATPTRILAGAVLFVLTLCAYAQEDLTDPVAEDGSAGVLEEVVVTGYHIKRTGAEGPAPVLVMDAELLEQAGIETLQDFANYLPINYPEADRPIGAIGATGFDLRGIGIDTTLTLVNGLRIAPYSQLAENAVDINAIPVSAIERIEILKDGASAIYGADAIAGVVNIILKSDFDGMAFSTGYGVSEHGDGEELLADFMLGRTFDNGAITVAFSWYDRGPQAGRDRGWSGDSDYSSIGGPNRRSAFGSPPSLLRYDNITTQHDPACGTDPALSSVGEGYWGALYGTGCRFNFAHYQNYHWGFERLGAFVTGHYEVRDGLRLFGDLLYSGTRGEGEAAPSPMSGSPEIETLAGFPFVPAWHPGNPFGTDGELFYRAMDLGNRVQVNDSTAYRAVLGLEGFRGEWEWQVSVLTSENRADTDLHNMVPVTRFQLALLGMGGPDGNLFYNPFGFEPQNDPELRDWLTASAAQSDTSEEHSIDLLVRRAFGELPGGPVGFAFGLQYREQKLDQWADDLLRSGDVGFRHVPIAADRDIGSAFVEFSLPLLDGLEAQLALRYEDYSDFGSTTNPKIALRWQVLDSLAFRGSYSTSFKPPSFFELYEPANQGWGWYRDTVRCEYTGLQEDCDYWLYRVEGSGNPDLQPEDGESWFAGLVWTPEFADGLEVQLDLWEFRHEDRIEWLPGQTVLDAGGDRGIIREPSEADGTPGRIVLVRESGINYEEVRTRGFDTTLRYGWETQGAGDFHATFMHTYVDEYRFEEALDAFKLQLNAAGRQPPFGVALPRNRANANFSWQRHPHAAAVNIHYISHFTSWDNAWVDGERTDESMEIGSHTTLDAHYSYTFENYRGAVLSFGCDNVTDEDPPLVYFPSAQPFHDSRGRYFYVRWQQPLR